MTYEDLKAKNEELSATIVAQDATITNLEGTIAARDATIVDLNNQIISLTPP